MMQQRLRRPQSFIQIRFDTGQLTMRHRGEAVPMSIDHMLPIIDADGGIIRGEPELVLGIRRPIDMRGARMPGAAYLELASPGAVPFPFLAAMACWNAALDEAAWNRWRRLVRSLALKCRPFEGFVDAPSSPWLARLDLPGPRPASAGASQAIEALIGLIFFGFIESE